jgi:glycogen synthase
MPDVIHAQNFFNGGLSAVKIKEKFNVPIVLTEHNSQFMTASINERQLGFN